MDIEIGKTYYCGKLSRKVIKNSHNEIYYLNESNEEKHCWITTFKDWVNRGIRLDKQSKMTKADKFRSLTDIELAKLIASGEWSCICPYCNKYGEAGCEAFDDENVDKDKCEQGILEFLQSTI
jgi:hypothetical protein